MHRYDHMSSWTAKKSASEWAKMTWLADTRDSRSAEELGKQLSVLREKQPKKKLSKLHDTLEDVLSRG